MARREQVRAKGELRSVLGTVSLWDKGDLAGHQAPNRSLTWGKDLGGQGVWKPPTLRQDLRANL